MKRAREAGDGSVPTVRASQQSAAEFFSEHQQIAGFDNAGKSLYTTIREFVENSLDAAESIQILPDVHVTVREYTEEEHNLKHGIDVGAMGRMVSLSAEPDLVGPDAAPPAVKKAKSLKSIGGGDTGKEKMYYDVTCRDNGCGIAPDQIGNMLGRVLSGSKQGLKQTRGKFGLGAKMALIWSKKSSGLPITIRSAHSTSLKQVPATVTTTVLDIDIHRNEPRIISSKVNPNHDGWRGLEIMVTICGTWSNYRSRVLQYFQQLAVITPYAELKLDFQCLRDDKKSFSAAFVRRSEQMPPVPKVILPHPKSMNNITLSNLLKSTSGSTSLTKFLTSELSGISTTLANKIATTLGLEECRNLRENVTPQQVAALCQILRDESTIKPPSGACLSPAGEYNMRLGVLKELLPTMVATFTDKSGVYEGQPFLVEAAVSLGGRSVREGINVFRFANRIPMLFESGADVITQVAMKRINWSSYFIDPKKESVGVYVSVVSTKIPFKGTSKEYIGDDVIEIQQSVRRALLGCCQQLRTHLARSLARKEHAERRKALLKYIPDVSRSLMIVVSKMDECPDRVGASFSLSKKALAESILQQFRDGKLTEEVLKELLEKSVNRLENSGTAIEGECATGTVTAETKTQQKSANKTKLVAEAKTYRLAPLDADLLKVQEELFKRCTPSYMCSRGSNTFCAIEGNKLQSNKSDFEDRVANSVIDLGEVEISQQQRESSQGNTTAAGRWLQISGIGVKIWVEA